MTLSLRRTSQKVEGMFIIALGNKENIDYIAHLLGYYAYSKAQVW